MVNNNISDFALLVKKTGSLIGIDYGKRKIGLAISDPNRQFSMPLMQISETNLEKQIAQISAILQQKQAAGVVLGMPVNMDGSEGAQANIVKEFANKLYQSYPIAIFLQDERLTSKTSSNLLKMVGVGRKKRESKEDAVAASLILDSTLMQLQGL